MIVECEFIMWTLTSLSYMCNHSRAIVIEKSSAWESSQTTKQLIWKYEKAEWHLILFYVGKVWECWNKRMEKLRNEIWIEIFIIKVIIKAQIDLKLIHDKDWARNQITGW
jgi:hypothetical protein